VAFSHEFFRPHDATGGFSIDAPGVASGPVDDDGHAVTAELVAGATRGTVSLNADGSFSYAPADPNALLRDDYFTYRLFDGYEHSNVATALITIANTPPVALDEMFIELHGTPGPYGRGLRFSDADNDPLSLVLVTPPTHGSVEFTEHGFRFYPPNGFLQGTDTFSFKVNDGYSNSNVATVEIVVGNSEPIALDLVRSIRVDQTVLTSLIPIDTDVEDDPVTAAGQVGQPEHGSVVLSADGTFTYTPFPEHGLFGRDSFGYRLSDGYAESNVGIVTITQEFGEGLGRSDSISVVNPDDFGVEALVFTPGLLVGNDAFSSGWVAGPYFLEVDPSSLSDEGEICNLPRPGCIVNGNLPPVLDRDENYALHVAPGFRGTLTFDYEFRFLNPAGRPFDLGAGFTVRESSTATVLIQVTGEPDDDADGIVNRVELAVPNGGDANGDGDLDYLQRDVATLQTAGGYVTLEVSGEHSSTQLFGVSAAQNPSPDDVPAGAEFPVGFLSFAITGLASQNVAEGATVTVHLPSGRTANTYYKFGKEPGNETPHWYEFLYDGLTGAETHAQNSAIPPGQIVLHYVDGQRGDDDLSVNGVIVDPGAPATTSLPIAGDVNADGSVDRGDVAIIARNLGVVPAAWDEGDLNDDDRVSLTDLLVVQANFGAGEASPAAAPIVAVNPGDGAGRSRATLRARRAAAVDRVIGDEALASALQPALSAQRQRIAGSRLSRARSSSHA
jgi:hypothetical protein